MTPSDPARDIRIIREPSVYLVGRQTVDQTVIDKFLTDHGVSWQTDSEVAGEYLSEVAGRVCYMSFAKPRPGVTRFISSTSSKSATARYWNTRSGILSSPGSVARSPTSWSATGQDS